jgi:hypothetical protein
MHTDPLAATLASVELGVPVTVDNLTMLPLLARHPREPKIDYIVLDEAMTTGEVEITEISDEGSVPDLRVINRGAKPVLILDGEELLGAKQNRVVNLTILVPAHAELTIPVSCVEAGRWRARSRAFSTSPRTQYASGRAKRMAHVSEAMMCRGDRMSDQAGIWDDIAEKSERLSASSPTSAMAAIYKVHERSIDSFVEAMAPVERQVGAVFAVGQRVIGFDLFDRPATLARLLSKLVRSAAIDALDAPPPPESRHLARPGILKEAEQFLAVTAGAKRHVDAGLGLGEDVRLTAAHLAGAALVVRPDTVHVGSFAL